LSTKACGLPQRRAYDTNLQLLPALGMNETSYNAVASLLYCAAAFCLFLPFANRFLLLMKDSRLKGPLLAVLFLVLAAGAARLSLSLNGYVRWSIPILVLAVSVAGEIRRLVMRRRMRGSPPVERGCKPLSLLQPVTTIDLGIARYEIKLPSALKPFRVAHLSDFHVSHSLPLDYFLGVMERVVEMKPDFVFLTGDFVTLASGIPILEQIIRPLGMAATIASLGNHDIWVDGPGIASVLRSKGIMVLNNTSGPWRAAEFGLVVSACEDPWSGSRWQQPDVESGETLFVLSHTPDNIYRVANAGAAAMFSGHCHAGQFKIPYFGSLVVPSRYGRRFDHGHFIVKGVHLFITAGVGVATPALRLYCHPDIFVVDIIPGPV